MPFRVGLISLSLCVGAVHCVFDGQHSSTWSEPDASVSFIGVDALGPCQSGAMSMGATPVVHVLADRAFKLSVTVKLQNIERGQLRAQVEPLRAGAEKVTFPLAPGKDSWEGKAVITVPEEGEHAFVVRVADVEQTVRVRVVAVKPELTITVHKPTKDLWPVEVLTSCGTTPLANQSVTLESLPEVTTLPAGGLITDAQGNARLTLKVPEDKLPTRIDVVSGRARKGCVLLMGASSVDGDCTLQ